MRPIEIQNEVLAKEIALLKERITKTEEKQLKYDIIFKKLFEKFPDLSSSL